MCAHQLASSVHVVGLGSARAVGPCSARGGASVGCPRHPYLQRAARHIASQTDADQAYALGQAAIEYALAGENNVMLTIQREASPEYQWSIGTTPLKNVANVERTIPRDYITDDGFGITDACRQYLQPLIQGEAYPPYKNGMPQYVRLKNKIVAKKLNKAFAV